MCFCSLGPQDLHWCVMLCALSVSVSLFAPDKETMSCYLERSVRQHRSIVRLIISAISRGVLTTLKWT